MLNLIGDKKNQLEKSAMKASLETRSPLFGHCPISLIIKKTVLDTRSHLFGTSVINFGPIFQPGLQLGNGPLLIFGIH